MVEEDESRFRNRRSPNSMSIPREDASEVLTLEIALTTSGGGYRSLLTGAGVIQGLDARDSNVSTSGLF
jgi:hypothetical protein